MLYIYPGQVGNIYTLRRTHCHRVIQRDQINNSLRTHFTQLHHFCLHQHMKRAHLPMAAMPKVATQDESSMLAVEFKTRSILHRPDPHAGPKQSQHTMKNMDREKGYFVNQFQNIDSHRRDFKHPHTPKSMIITSMQQVLEKGMNNKNPPPRIRPKISLKMKNRYMSENFQWEQLTGRVPFWAASARHGAFQMNTQQTGQEQLAWDASMYAL